MFKYKLKVNVRKYCKLLYSVYCSSTVLLLFIISVIVLLPTCT